jgi:hypothetical protein
MARTYLIFSDIEGKLDVLRVECTKYPRKGRYSVPRLIEKSGRKANIMKWKEQLSGDCPKQDAHETPRALGPNLPGTGRFDSDRRPDYSSSYAHRAFCQAACSQTLRHDRAAITPRHRGSPTREGSDDWRDNRLCFGQ